MFREVDPLRLRLSLLISLAFEVLTLLEVPHPQYPNSLLEAPHPRGVDSLPRLAHFLSFPHVFPCRLNKVITGTSEQ